MEGNNNMKKINNKKKSEIIKNNKKNIAITIAIVIITNLINILLFNVISNDGHEEVKKSESEKIKADSQETNSKSTEKDYEKDYVYYYIPKISEENNHISNKVYATLDKAKITSETNSGVKYEVECEDDNKVVYKCSESNAHVINSEKNNTYKYSYFTYTINEKNYIKNFITNEFVINPNEYDEIYYDSRYIIINKDKKTRFYDCENKKFINSEYNIENIKIDKIFVVTEERVLVQEQNNIKLYNKNSLLWDYGNFDYINDLVLYEIIPTSSFESESYAMAYGDGKPSFVLVYDKNTKQGYKSK